MNIIKKLFVNGKWSKLSKDALADDVSSSLLPPATAEDEGKVVSVTETGEYGLSTVESGLPVATAEDAGKVVAVDDSGEYELAVPSGGVLVITATAFGNGGTLDKTYSEIVAAISAGKVPMVALPDFGYSILLSCFYVNEYSVEVYGGKTSDDVLFTSDTADGVLTYSSM